MRGELDVERPDGTLAMDVRGDGPAVIAFPGMGDLRQNFRFLAPMVAEAGYTFASVDLRGHGGSSAGWPDYSEAAIATDYLAVIDAMGGRPSTLIGNSISGGAAIVAAAARPDLVAGLVLLAPFARPQHQTLAQRVSTWAVARTPFGRALWDSYVPTLYAGAKPADLGGYRRALARNLAEPGRFEAVARMADERHEGAQAASADVRVPALIAMGLGDPDWPDPVAEARAISEALGGGAEVVPIPDAGHYPHAQRPDVVGPAVVRFLSRVTQR